MNRGELVSYIIQRVGQTDNEDITACRAFLSKRYELIYQSYLWKDSLIACNVTVDPTDANNAEGIVLVPSMIDRVVAVRTPSNAVRIHGMEEYYAIDYDKFSKQGTAYEFTILSPIWFKWRGLVGLKVVSVTGDDGQKVKILWRDSRGLRHTSVLTLNSVAPPTLTDTPSGNSIVVTGAGSDGYNGSYYYSPEGDGIYFRKGNYTLRYQVVDEMSQEWVLVSGRADYTKQVVQDPAVMISPFNDWTVLTGNEPAPTLTKGVITTIEIEAMFKPASVGDVTLAPILPFEDSGGTLAAADTRSDGFPRLRLLGIPQQQVVLSILGKKKASALDFDQEEPELKNIDNALIELVMGDMRDRQRQTGKAQACWQAGDQLIRQLAQIETIQSANNSHFMPVAGMGDSYFGPSLGYEYGLSP